MASCTIEEINSSDDEQQPKVMELPPGLAASLSGGGGGGAANAANAADAADAPRPRSGNAAAAAGASAPTAKAAAAPSSSKAAAADGPGAAPPADGRKPPPLAPPLDAEKVTPDGGVLKVTLEAGSGDAPVLHARCLGALRCVLRDDCVGGAGVVVGVRLCMRVCRCKPTMQPHFLSRTLLPPPSPHHRHHRPRHHPPSSTTN